MRSLRTVDEATLPTESRSRAPSRASSRSSSRSHRPDEYQPDEYQPDEYPPQSPSETSEPGDFTQVPSEFDVATRLDLWGRTEGLLPLTSEQCMIADPWLIAFDLKTKRWGKKITSDQLPK